MLIFPISRTKSCIYGNEPCPVDDDGDDESGASAADVYGLQHEPFCDGPTTEVASNIRLFLSNSRNFSPKAWLNFSLFDVAFSGVSVVRLGLWRLRAVLGRRRESEPAVESGGVRPSHRHRGEHPAVRHGSVFSRTNYVFWKGFYRRRSHMVNMWCQ